MHKSINYNVHDMKRQFAVICASYASVPVTRVPKVKVGVVGEIYVKYSPLGNNDLEKFLESQDCESEPARPDGLCRNTVLPT